MAAKANPDSVEIIGKPFFTARVPLTATSSNGVISASEATLSAKSNAISIVPILKGQFEVLAREYPRLNSLFLVAPSGQREKIAGPFPINDCRTQHELLSRDFSSPDLQLRIADSETASLKLSKIAIHDFMQIQGLYIADVYRPEDVERHYISGSAHFKRLAEQAGELLLVMPAEVINVYPPEWKRFETYLRVNKTIDCDLTPEAEGTRKQFQCDAILPPGNSHMSRWMTYLHWLAWRGDVPGLNAKRQTWVGNHIYPWMEKQDDHDKFFSMFPIQWLTFAESRHFFSLIPNVFLASALALSVIERQLLNPLRTSESSRTPAPWTESAALQSGNSTQATSSVPTLESQNQDTPKPIRDTIFISYCHKDARWLEPLKAHLGSLRHSGSTLDHWDDTRLKVGQDWREEIRKALAKTKVAVLLISAQFLSSDFIANDELPALLAAAETDGAVIMPVIISECRFSRIPSLSRFQAVNPNLIPLLAMKRNNRERLWNNLTNAIDEAFT